ncbi:MAG: helix-turn-helix domain-containing protein [Plesiomonas shigelloides]
MPKSMCLSVFFSELESFYRGKQQNNVVMTAMTTKKPETSAVDSSEEAIEHTLESKWGKTTLSLGWTGVPNILVERQRALGLTPLDVSLLLILMKYWRDPMNPPYPSKRVIGEMLGRDESTIRKAIKELENKKLLSRNARFMSLGGQTSNGYSMDGLVKALEVEAAEMKRLKDERTEEDARIRRGGKINK